MDIERALKDIVANLAVTESQYEFDTSAGAELSAGTKIVQVALNGTMGSIWLREKGGSRFRLNYGGLGGSVGLSMIPSPINLALRESRG